MGLCFFYGMDRDALQEYCRQEAQKSGKSVLIVPEQFSLSGETSFMDLQRTGTVVTSFRRFAQQLFEQTGTEGEYLSGSAKLILMERALQKCASKMTVYKSSAEKKGFADTLCKTVAELKHADITPQVLREKGEQMSQHSYLQEKLADLSLIYQQYLELLETAGRDADDDLTRLTRLLSERPEEADLQDTTLLLYYFSGFTPQERKVISALEGLCSRVLIGLVTEDCVSKPDTKLCFWSTVRNIEAFSALTPSFVRVQGGQESRTADLAFLSKQYFAYPYQTRKGAPNGIRIFAADHPYEEAEMVAAEIVRLCREEGFRYRDFAVVARELSGYEDVLEQVFSLFEIPYFTDQKEQVTTHPLVSFLLSVRDIFEYRWNYESVFHFVKSYFSPISKENGDALENFALAYGIFGNMWTDEELWRKKLDRAFSEEDCGYCRDTIEQGRELLVRPLLRLRERTVGKRPYREQAKALFLFLEELGMYDRLAEKTEQLRQEGRQQQSEEYRQLWNALLHVLDQVAALAGEEQGSFSKFMDLLEEGFCACSIGSVPPCLDSVTVTSADRFVGEQVNCLFVIGVNEGEFPASGIRGGLLDGTERDVLEAFGLETAVGRQKSAYMEQEIIYKVISLAQKQLIVTYRKADMDQTARAPSNIIRRICELFPDIKTESVLPAVSAPGYTFAKMAEHPEGYHQAREWFADQPKWAGRLELLEREGDRQQVKLSDKTVQSLYRQGIYASVSKLEKFNRCPFSFHATYHLKAKERRQYRLGAPDTGSFLHDVLEQCAHLIDQSASLSWQTITREECGWLVDRIVDESAPQWFGGLLVSSPRYTYLTARLKRLLSKNLYYISLHFKNGLFRPLGYELEFKEKGDLPPVTLYTGDGAPVKLTGKVDRADVYQTPDGSWIRIVDYKSGPKDLYINDVYYGLNLQLVTYLDAMCTEEEPAGIFYFNVTDPYTRTEVALDGTELAEALRKNYKMKGLVLANRAVLYAMDQDCDGGSDLIPAYVKKDGDVSGSVASEEEFSLLRKQVRSCLKQLACQIEQGRVDVLPVKTKREFACTYCEFSALCGYEGETGRCRKLTDLSKEEILRRMKEGDNG